MAVMVVVMMALSEHKLEEKQKGERAPSKKRGEKTAAGRERGANGKV